MALSTAKMKFIADISALVQKYAPLYGIKVCSPVIAQAILESGWGETKLASLYHNYFGMKCGTLWKGKSVNLTTKEEYTAGALTTIKDNFRVYDSMEEGVKGYFEFIQLERYQNLKGITDPKKYIETIKADGYATSSTYVANVYAVITAHNLTQYDPGANVKAEKSITEQDAINALIAVALAEVGYLEKASNSQLDDKTANAGSRNYTKYGRDMHAILPGVMDFPAAWCDCFVDWCFVQAFGQVMARALLCGNFDDYTVYSAQYYKNKGRWYNQPKAGDQVFFTNSSGGICHTGIVTKVSGGILYTVEGNTSSAAGVVANGGCVREKTYQLGYSRIAGYGRPDYSAVAEVFDNAENSGSGTEMNETNTAGGIGYMFDVGNVQKGSKGNDVKLLQRLLKSNGCKGADGKALTIDGDCGTNTAHAIKAYQKKKGLSVDGVAGPKTWKSILLR